MADTRDHILAALRQRLSHGKARDAAAESAAAEAVRARLSHPPRGPVCGARAPHDNTPGGTSTGLSRLFCRQLEAAAGHWVKADGAHAVVDAVRGLCPSSHMASHRASQAESKEKITAPTLVTAPDPVLQALPWAADQRPAFRPVSAGDSLALTRAWAGIAETGSLVLRAGPHTPTALNFLPDTLICLLELPLILPALEDVWTQQRREGLPMPRALNLITGPSRTADVEQSIQLGAHGPRQLHVILCTQMLE